MTTLDFSDSRINNDELNYWGYTKIGVMPDDMLKDFWKETKALVKEAQQLHDPNQILALINASHHLKLKSNAIVGKYLNMFLREFISEDEADVFPVGHIIKPFGLKSDICHQDSTIVEEEEGHFSLNAWVSFVDSNRMNGCIWALPGSHTFEHYYRPFIPNPFFEKPITKDIWKKMTPIHSEPGEVLLFHRSLVHGSSRNYLPWARIAAESIIKTKGAPFVQYRFDSEISEDKIVRYEVPFKHFMKPVPKEDFYNKVYPYQLRDCETEDEIVDKLQRSFPSFEAHAKLKNEEVDAALN